MEGFERRDPNEEADRAVLGRRIERWDILRDTQLSFKERREKLDEELQLEMASLIGKPVTEALRHDMHDLMLDAKSLQDLEDDEAEIERLVTERQAHHRFVLEAAQKRRT